jgi:hypothetical protein
LRKYLEEALRPVNGALFLDELPEGKKQFYKN